MIYLIRFFSNRLDLRISKIKYRLYIYLIYIEEEQLGFQIIALTAHAEARESIQCSEMKAN